MNNDYIIELKFYDREWKNYFHGERFSREKAYDLYNKLIKNYPSSQWRIIKIEQEHLKVEDK